MLSWLRRKPTQAQVKDVEAPQSPPAPPPKPPAPAGQAKPGQPGYEAQQAMMEAMEFGREVCLAGPGHYVGSSANTGFTGFTLECQRMSPDEVSDMLHDRKIFDSAAYLGALPGYEDDEPLRLIYLHLIKMLPDVERQKLYQLGGIPAIREVVLCEAKRLLGREDDTGDNDEDEVEEPELTYWQNLWNAIKGIRA